VRNKAIPALSLQAHISGGPTRPRRPPKLNNPNNVVATRALAAGHERHSRRTWPTISPDFGEVGKVARSGRWILQPLALPWVKKAKILGACVGVATCYDKLAANSVAFIQSASISLWLRADESTPWLGAVIRINLALRAAKPRRLDLGGHIHRHDAFNVTRRRTPGRAVRALSGSEQIFRSFTATSLRAAGSTGSRRHCRLFLGRRSCRGRRAG
jgi:hypothetical protein